MLMPSRLGMAISRRLTRYCPITIPQPGSRPPLMLLRCPSLRLAVPVRERPEIVVPAAERGAQPVGCAGHSRPVDNRNDHVVVAHQIVHADEQGRPPDRIEL